ncbi:MAG: hypothetical protein FWC74_10070, partial [Candidatus Bathyarchaeota archaeon]|nr:hypothetical protein [Candidatus Termitimicrobium sp.]
MKQPQPLIHPLNTINQQKIILNTPTQQIHINKILILILLLLRQHFIHINNNILNNITQKHHSQNLLHNPKRRTRTNILHMQTILQ